MPRFIVYETTEVTSVYEVEAQDAPSAIRKTKKGAYISSPTQELEQRFKAKIIEEETDCER